MASTPEKICLPVSRKSIPLSDFNNPSMAKVSPDGRWLLYGGETDKNKKVTPVILMDLISEKKTEFFPPYNLSESENRIAAENKSGYGFANKGALAWVWSKNNDIKLKSLSDGEEKWIHGDTDYYTLTLDIKEDIGILWSIGFDKSQINPLLALEQELKSKPPSEKAKLKEEIKDRQQKVDLIMKLVDMNTLSEMKRTLPMSAGNCGRMDISLNFFYVQRDGSLYKTNLKTGSDPVELFGPVEGLQLPHFMEDQKGLTSQCAIDPRGFNVIRKPEGGYLLRVIEEEMEYHLPNHIFNLHFSSNGETRAFQRHFLYLSDMLDNFIRYPFIVSSSAIKISPRNIGIEPYIARSGKALLKNVTEWLIYHIPSQTAQIKQNTKLMVAHRNKGIFALEDSAEGKDEIIQAVFHPFDLEKRRILMELNSNEACLVKMDENLNQTFLNTVWGDLFIIDMKTGAITRRNVGRCLHEVNTVSEHTLILQNRDQTHTAHRFQEQCFQPESGVIDRKQALSHVAESTDPTGAASLALLMAALESDSMKEFPELTRQALWNILSRSFILFLHLYRSFPDLNQIPALPITEMDPERKKKLEASTASLLKFTTEEYRASRLSDWKFLNLLHPFLDSLSEEERSIYMEKIIVSVTNGATKAIPVLRDVFQSKLYYVAQGHIKELFGLKRRPVSDITLIRKKPAEWSLPDETQTRPHPHLYTQPFSAEEKEKYTSFIIPLILSSDPIEGAPDTATDFGIHYAVLEKSVRPVLKNQKMGSQLLSEKAEWKLLKNGAHYRARFSVSVKLIRNKLMKSLESPDYNSIWKDHKMAGAVIVGSSLYGFSKTLLEEYLAYFQEQGFQFVRTKTSNLKEFLLEGIKSCELDYFLKESHSDGDERNIFRFNRANYIAQGVRYGEEGRIEVVYIIFPPPLNLPGLKTDLLSNKELGQAIQERERKGCGQLTYFNTSCWSDVKARYEIEAVNSPLFLNIPAISLTDTF